MELFILDQNEVTSVRLKIAAEKFSFYRCDTKKSYSFRMHALIKIMSWVDSRDKLSLQVADQANCLTVCYESGSGKREFELYLIASQPFLIPVSYILLQVLLLQLLRFYTVVVVVVIPIVGTSFELCFGHAITEIG